MQASTARRRSANAIGACLFVAYAYFYQGGGWNQNSRFALVRAILEHQTLRVDDTASFDGRRITGDLASYKGHLYSDKAPGLALAAVPVVGAARTFVEHPASREGIAILSYIATVLTAALPSVLAALLVFYLADAFGASHGAAVAGALVFGLGSPAWAYATLFYGHALATACLVAAFSAAVALRRFSSRARDRLMATIVGAGGGWATVTEYTAVVPAAIIALLAFLCARSEEPGRRGRVIVALALAALACGAVIGLFNTLSFGRPFDLGYSYVVGFQEMTQGSFAFGAPARGVIWALLFGQYRGLFALAPVLALAPLGFVLLARDPSTRAPAITAFAITAYYLLLNASFHYWHAGWSFGPRYMAPILPFMSIGVAIVWSRAAPAVRVVLCALALYGVAVTFVAVATTAQPRDDIERPVAELLWPNFVAGRLAINWQSFVEDRPADERDRSAHAWNLGEKLGLTGLTSLVPLIAMWSVLAGLYGWRHRHEGPSG
jgi:MFS family permease